MKKAILVDIHNTLIDEVGNPNRIIVEIVKDLSTKYEILVFTAENLTNKKSLELELVLHKLNIVYSGLYYLNSDEDDVDKKLDMLKTIYRRFRVMMLIDNNKKVCKAFSNRGIETLRYKQLS